MQYNKPMGYSKVDEKLVPYFTCMV